MVDLKRIREQPEEVKAGLRKKRADPELIDQALRADRRRRELVHQVETLRAAQNKASQEIARLAGAAREERIAEMKRLAGQPVGGVTDLRQLEHRSGATQKVEARP